MLRQQQATVQGSIDPNGNYCIGLSRELWSLLKLGDISPRNTLFSNGRKSAISNAVKPCRTIYSEICKHYQPLEKYIPLSPKFRNDSSSLFKSCYWKEENIFAERWCLKLLLSSFVFLSSTTGWREHVSHGWQTFQDWRMWGSWGMCLWYGLFGKKAYSTVHWFSPWGVCVSLEGRNGHPGPKKGTT